MTGIPKRNKEHSKSTASTLFTFRIDEPFHTIHDNESRTLTASDYQNIPTATASFVQAKVDLPGKDFSVFMKEIEADSEKAELLKNARMELSERLSDTGAFPLSKLRLSKGLSQSQVAEKMGVSQAHVAKVENGDGNVRVDTIEKFADALGESFSVVSSAFYLQRQRRKEVS